jgi:hypothetical protein
MESRREHLISRGSETVAMASPDGDPQYPTA